MTIVIHIYIYMDICIIITQKYTKRNKTTDTIDYNRQTQT